MGVLKVVVWVSTVGLLAACSLPHTSQPLLAARKDVAYERYDFTPIRVKDGDTIEGTITRAGVLHFPDSDTTVTLSIVDTVRLDGINTPESGGRERCQRELVLATAAKAFVSKQLAGQHSVVLVTRQGREREKYGRVLGDLEVDGRSLRDLLIVSGYADPYDGGYRDPARWCQN